MRYYIERASLKEDKDSILGFWKRGTPDWRDGKFPWFYENNVGGEVECWVARETNTHEIVGSTAIFPRKFLFKGEGIQAGITGDFAVDERCRGFGPAVLLQRAVVQSCKSNGYHFLYGYPNHSSLPVQKRVGFEVLGSSVRLVKVLKYYPYMINRLRRPVLSKALSAILDPIARLLEKKRQRIISPELKGEVIESFDSRFDELYRKCSEKSDLLGERNSEFLHWRFSQCPYRKYRTFTLSKRVDNQLLGYVVYSADEHRANIADFLACDSQAMFEHLLVSFCQFLWASGYWSVSVIYLGNKGVFEKLRKMGFHEREDKRDVVIYVKNDSLHEHLKNIENWHFLEGDND